MTDKELFEAAFRKLLSQSYALECDYCKHKIPCGKDICPHYWEEKGDMYLGGELVRKDYPYTCQDVEYDNCKARIHTPCSSCDNGDNLEFDMELVRYYVESQL